MFKSTLPDRIVDHYSGVTFERRSPAEVRPGDIVVSWYTVHNLMRGPGIASDPIEAYQNMAFNIANFECVEVHHVATELVSLSGGRWYVFSGQLVGALANQATDAKVRVSGPRSVYIRTAS